jgi:hypothetical protein
MIEEYENWEDSIRRTFIEMADYMSPNYENFGNRLCRAIVTFNCPKSLFSSFELVTVREYNDYNGGTYIDEISTAAEYLDASNAYDDPFYRIYGIYKNSMPRREKFIADFFYINEARNFLYELTGEDVHIISY